MLIEWRVKNFKSLKDVKLPVAGLNILCGVNSSGKSSLIQSILLVSQTMISKMKTRAVELNGTLFQCGEMQDIIHSENETGDVSIGWLLFPIGTKKEPNYLSFFGHAKGELLFVKTEFSFSDRKKTYKLQRLQLDPHLKSLSMTCMYDSQKTDPQKIKADESPDGNYYSLSAVFSDVKKKKSYSRKLRPDSLKSKSSVEYEVQLDTESKRSISQFSSTAGLEGLTFNHFLPDDLLISFDRTERYAEFQTQNLLQAVLGESEVIFENAIPEPILRYVSRSVSEEYRKLFTTKSNQPLSFSEVAKRAKHLTKAKRQELRTFLNVRKNDLKERLTREYAAEYVTSTLPMPEQFSRATSYIETYFSTKVKYLGPLREEPRSLYPLPTMGTADYIGIRGEYSAAVLHYHKDVDVFFVPPNELDNLSDPKFVTAPLGVAVTQWLQYFGLAFEFETGDQGKSGHEIRVNLSAGQSTRDLTHVGFGISQVLPILVLGLLSEFDDLLLFEQPELHCHPSVQAKLADFFLSLSKGRQCVVETHSEYIINRLRYRIAKNSVGDMATTMPNIYFARMIDGSTVFENIRVNEFGVIENWPDDFFDQTEKESEEILNAVLEKSRKK